MKSLIYISLIVSLFLNCRERVSTVETVQTEDKNSSSKESTPYFEIDTLVWKTYKQKENEKGIPRVTSKFIGVYTKLLSSGDSAVITISNQSHRGVNKDVFKEFVKSQGTYINHYDHAVTSNGTLLEYFETNNPNVTLIDTAAQMILRLDQESYGLEEYTNFNAGFYRLEKHVTMELSYKSELHTEVIPDYELLIESFRWK